jgi:hypothetical protein
MGGVLFKEIDGQSLLYLREEHLPNSLLMPKPKSFTEVGQSKCDGLALQVRLIQ